MSKKELRAFCSSPNWRWGTPEGAELHTLLLGLLTTFREKLQWMEEMETMLLKMRAARKRTAPKKRPVKKKVLG